MKLPTSAVCRIELEKRIAKWIEDTREERMKTAAWVIRTISSATKLDGIQRFTKTKLDGIQRCPATKLDGIQRFTKTKPNQSRRFIKFYPRDTSSPLGVGRDHLD